jgi:23S rRNA (cytosine1962-C5)-methyltransferase
MATAGTVVLKAGKERPVIQRHPWVFSGAIKEVRSNPPNGAAVDVCDSHGGWLAAGLISHHSQIRVRLLSWDAHTLIDEALLRARIARALQGRTALALRDGAQGALRLINAESDGLPGLIVDRYASYLVVQLLTYGMAQRADLIVAALAELVAPQGIYERSDADVRAKEGLQPAEGLRWGKEAPARLTVAEHGARLLVDLRQGQKTGHYLDQRENRVAVARYCRGAELLDCFSYSGGFSLQAARAGASAITAVDISAPALELLRENMALNEHQAHLEAEAGDVFSLLRRYRAEGRRWDVIVLDPPKFAQSQAQVERASRGYKDINLLAMQLLRPGGILASFSCSGLVSAELFQKIVFGAALDARRDVQLIERLSQAPDHPVLLSFPEAAYLKGLICRVW